MNTYFALTRLTDMSPTEVHKLYKLRADTLGSTVEDADASPAAHHVLAWTTTDDAQPALHGYARIIPTSTELLEVTHLSHLYAADGSGLIREILDNALRFAAENYPDRDVIVTAPKNLRDLYTSFGFHAYGLAQEDGHPMILATTQLHALFRQKVNA